MSIYLVVIVMLALVYFASTYYLLKTLKQNGMNKSNSIIAMMILVPILSFMLYLHLGGAKEYEKKVQFEKNANYYEQVLKQLSSQKSSLHETIALIQARQKNYPEDINGWFLLGKLYYAAQEFSAANIAYEKALNYAPNDSHILKAYTESLYASNEKLDKRIEIFEQLLSENPKDHFSQNMLAVSYFQAKNYSKAIQSWSALRLLATDNKKAYDALTSLINKAKYLQKSVAITFNFTIDLAENLKNRLQSFHTLFVFVKTEKNTRPLLVKKININHLPEKIALDETNSMQGTVNLSKLKQVVVGARLSKKGIASKQAGDIGVETSVSLQGANTYEVKLVLDTVY